MRERRKEISDRKKETQSFYSCKRLSYTLNHGVVN